LIFQNLPSRRRQREFGAQALGGRGAERQSVTACRAQERKRIAPNEDSGGSRFADPPHVLRARLRRICAGLWESVVTCAFLQHAQGNVVIRKFRDFLSLSFVRAILWIAAAVALYNIYYPTYAYRYRLVLAIEIDGQRYIGSSVNEVSFIARPKILVWAGGNFEPRFMGQSVFIDLGKHGAIVTTLGGYLPDAMRRSSSGGVGGLYLAAKAFGNTSSDEELPKLPRLSGRRDLTPDDLPTMIYFPDIAHIDGARVLAAAADIPVLLGPDAHLAAAFVEITHDPVVFDVDKKLPWFNQIKRPGQSVSQVETALRAALSQAMFIRGKS
jgi:hypothetical protein